MMRPLLIACALLALAACNKAAPGPHNVPANAPAAEPGLVKGVDRSHKGQPFPAVKFLDGEDQPTSYEGFRGVPALVNLWATWCVPCVKELPTLEQLGSQRKNDLWVVPINQDMAPRASVEAFMKEHKLDLPIYRDPKMAISGALDAEVWPTSILYDANGREVWRYVGDMDWTSAEAAKLLAEGGVGKISGTAAASRPAG